MPLSPSQHKLLSQLSRWSYGLILVAVLAVSFHVHRRAGLTLPNPWNDEPRDLWAAKTWAETGRFMAPELNPDRPVVLYGGGYAATVGLFMRAFGYTLETARWLSWLGLAGAWIATARLLRRLPGSPLLLGLAGLFFLGPAHVVAGNMARPEALVLLIVTLGYGFLLKDQPLKAIFLCGLGVIVHPNALYFLLGTLIYVATMPSLWRRLWPPTRGDWIAIVACSISVLLSAAMIWSIWEWFYQDFFVVALTVNLKYDPLAKLADFRWWLALMGGLFLAARLLRQRSAIWMLYGLAALLISLMGGEMWYDVYKMTGFMALLTGGPVVLFQIGERLGQRWKGRPLGTACIGAGLLGAALGLLAMGHLSYRHGFIAGPRHYPQKLSWGWGMTMADPGVPYVTAEDKRIVAELALKIAGDHPAPLIEFPVTGDSFLFTEALPKPAIAFRRIDTEIPSQVEVYHLSRYIPAWVQKVILRDMAARNISESTPDYERDGTERWYVRAAARPKPRTSEP